VQFLRATSPAEQTLRVPDTCAYKRDLELAVVATNRQGTPIRIGDVANVSVGGSIRRGLVDLDGAGEVVGGIVVMRYGENALDAADRHRGHLLGLLRTRSPSKRCSRLKHAASDEERMPMAGVSSRAWVRVSRPLILARTRRDRLARVRLRETQGHPEHARVELAVHEQSAAMEDPKHQ
jgi:hypothetical protein